MQDNIIVKPSVEKQFDRFLRQGRVLFFSAPAALENGGGGGATVRPGGIAPAGGQCRLQAALCGADWQILLLDDLQNMQEEQDWNACAN